MTKKDLLSLIISKISTYKNVNQKRLDRALEYSNDLNYILLYYYQEERIKAKEYLYVEFSYPDDPKEYNLKNYKKIYDYNIDKLQPIKNYNTSMCIEYHNGYCGWCSWAFDVYEFIEVNNIELVN